MVAALRVSASEVMFVVAAVSSVACDSAESGVVELSAVAPFVALVANCWSSLVRLLSRHERGWLELVVEGWFGSVVEG